MSSESKSVSQVSAVNFGALGPCERCGRVTRLTLKQMVESVEQFVGREGTPTPRKYVQPNCESVTWTWECFGGGVVLSLATKLEKLRTVPVIHVSVSLVSNDIAEARQFADVVRAVTASGLLMRDFLHQVELVV